MIRRTFAIGSVGPAEAADADALAPILREADVREIAALDGRDPGEALRYSIDNAKFALALRDPSGAPVSLLGVGWIRTNPRAGHAWFVSSDRLDAFALVFLERVRASFDAMVAGHDVVSNWVHEPNAVTLRWLRWLGFERLSRHVAPSSGEAFLEMARFASPAVRDLYVERDWNRYHATLPARAELADQGFAFPSPAGHHGANGSDA